MNYFFCERCDLVKHSLTHSMSAFTFIHSLKADEPYTKAELLELCAAERKKIDAQPVTLNFGKYKGRQLSDILIADPSYIMWVHNANKSKDWYMDSRLRKEIEKSLRIDG